MTSTAPASITELLEASTYELLNELKDPNSPLVTRFNQLVTTASEKSTSREETKVFSFKFYPLSNGADLAPSREVYDNLGDNIVLLIDTQTIGLIVTFDNIPITGYMSFTPAEFLRHTVADGTARGIERLRDVIVGLEVIVMTNS